MTTGQEGGIDFEVQQSAVELTSNCDLLGA